VTLTKPRDRRVIRRLVDADHPARDVLDTRALDASRRALPTRVRVQQQRDHHARVMRRTPNTVPAIRRVERRQIHLLHSGKDEPHQVILRQPLLQAGQQHLLAITADEVLGHDRHRPEHTGQHEPELRNSHREDQHSRWRRRAERSCTPPRTDAT
jgi:hypothetical protein